MKAKGRLRTESPYTAPPSLGAMYEVNTEEKNNGYVVFTLPAPTLSKASF
jgi:hypothetical protein